MKKRILFCFAFIFAAAFTFAKPKATLTETDERFFWVIKGTDSKGNESTVYIQGTIHVGKEELYPLSETVLEAFDDADRYVSEISQEGVSEITSKVQERMLSSFSKTGGRKILDNLSEEEAEVYTATITEFGTSMRGEATGKRMVGLFNTLEPWISNTILTAYVTRNSSFKSELGLEQKFYKMLLNRGETWEGLDSVETQLDVLALGNYDEQMCILKSTIAELADEESTEEGIEALFDAYLKNDKERLNEVFSSSIKDSFEEDKELLKKYYNALIIARNKAWAKKIDGYLKQGGTTFLFAGCGHFVGDESVFKYLKKNRVIE